MPESKPVTKVITNLEKNRLEITIAGNIDSRSLEKLYTDIRFSVADLKDGFDVISDISHCNIIYLTGLPIFKKIMDYFVNNKIGQHLRITSDNKTSTRQLTHFFEKIQSYSSIYAENFTDAEEKLNILKKRRGIRLKLKNVVFEVEADGSLAKCIMVDISTSGCSFKSKTLTVSNDSAISIHLSFDPHESLESAFKIKAEIVRKDDVFFAVRFSDLDIEMEEKLYKRLSYEITHTPFLLNSMPDQS